MSNYNVSDVAYLPINRNREFYPFAFLTEKVDQLLTLVFGGLLTLWVLVRYSPDILIFLTQTISLSDAQNNEHLQEFILAMVSIFTLLIWLCMLFAVIYFSFFVQKKVELYKLAPFFFLAFSYIINFLIFSLLAFSKDKSGGITQSSNSEEENLRLIFIVSSSIKIAAVFVLVVLSWKYWKNIFLKLLERPHNIYLFGVVIAFLYYLLQKEKLIPDGGDSDNQQSLETIYKEGSTAMKVFFTFVVLFFGVIFEEFVYRFGIFQIFGRKNAILAIIFSSLIFAAAHHHSLLASVDYQNNSANLSYSSLFSHYSSLISYLIPAVLFANFFVFNDYMLIYPMVAHSIHNTSVLIGMNG